MISKKAAKKIEEQATQTVQQGGKIVFGGKACGKGFFEPCIVADVPHRFRCGEGYGDFGPVFPVIPVKSTQEAIEVANQSCYDLMGAVFGPDMAVTIQTAEALRCGGVVIACRRRKCLSAGTRKAG